MKKVIKFVGVSLLSIFGLGGWGGTVAVSPHYGIEDGAKDIIPASHDRFYWYAYNGGVDDVTWDEISYAVASIDRESTRFRFIQDQTKVLDSDEVRVAISVKPVGEAVPAVCSNSTPGDGCVLGETMCLQSLVVGGYRLCQSYRVVVYWNRIVANVAAHPGQDPVDEIYGIVRHELTHVLGFDHGSGGPMDNGANPLTPCQLDILELYNSQPTLSNFIYSTPASCL